MANHKSAIKRTRQTERKNQVNRRNRGRLRTQVKKLLRAIEAGEAESAKSLLNPTISVIDKSVQKGAIKKGHADRMKSRLTVRLNKTVSGAAA